MMLWNFDQILKNFKENACFIKQYWSGFRAISATKFHFQCMTTFVKITFVCHLFYAVSDTQNPYTISTPPVTLAIEALNVLQVSNWKLCKITRTIYKFWCISPFYTFYNPFFHIYAITRNLKRNKFLGSGAHFYSKSKFNLLNSGLRAWLALAHRYFFGFFLALLRDLTRLKILAASRRRRSSSSSVSSARYHGHVDVEQTRVVGVLHESGEVFVEELIRCGQKRRGY